MCRVYDNRCDPKLQTNRRPYTDPDDTHTVFRDRNPEVLSCQQLSSGEG